MNTPKNLGLCLFLTAFLCGPCSGAGEAPAPAVTAAQLTGLSKAAEQELRGDILPWWLKNARDRGHPPPPAPAAERPALPRPAERELGGDTLPWGQKTPRARGHGGFHSFIGE